MTMNDQQTYESIERYLAGEMDGKAKAAFEARLAAEPELREELRLHRELATVVEDEETMDFSAMVAEVVSGENEGRKGVSNFRWLALAASVVLIAVVGFFVFRSGGSNPQDLFNSNFSPYEAPAEFRTDSSLLVRYETAFEQYKGGDYKAAAASFEDLIEAAPEDLGARFYLAVCQLAQGDGAAAEAGFQDLLDRKAPTWRSQSQWYLALALLEQEKVEEAEKVLEELAARGGKYGSLAKELLKEL